MSLIGTLDCLEANLYRFFKGTKLDYPGKDCTKASRNYVKAMKSLQVCAGSSCIQFLVLMRLAGHYSPDYTIQQGLPRSTEKDLCIRPKQTHHCQRRPQSPMVPRNPDRRRNGSHTHQERARGKSTITVNQRLPMTQSRRQDVRR